MQYSSHTFIQTPITTVINTSCLQLTTYSTASSCSTIPSALNWPIADIAIAI